MANLVQADLVKKIEGLERDLLSAGANPISEDRFNEITARIQELKLELVDITGGGVGEGQIFTPRDRKL